MKKEFFKIAKKYNLTITEYNSFRSDMNCQVFDMCINFGEGNINHTDSYFIGENKKDKDKLLYYFENVFIKENI